MQLFNCFKMHTRAYFIIIFVLNIDRDSIIPYLFLNYLGLMINNQFFLPLIFQVNIYDLIYIQMRSNNKNRVWCEYEDKLITDFVKEYGVKNWAKIAEQLHKNGFKQKTGKQCRQRWHNHLDPKIKKKSWTRQQQDIMFEQHKKHGNKWTLIAQKLEGRTDNAIKNHFYSTIRKSLRRISKLKGDRNSTLKMRLIKPSALSKIFSLAQSNQEQDNISSTELSYQMSCKQIANYLLNFSRKKLGNKKYKLDAQEQKNFDRILSQMQKINHLYENEKLQQAKLKKQKQLSKHFDVVVSSSSDDEDSSQPDRISADNIDEQSQNILIKPNVEIFTTRSKRKVRPPTYFQIQYSQKRQKQKEPSNEKIKDIIIEQKIQIQQVKNNLSSPLRNFYQQEQRQCFSSNFKYNDQNMNEISTFKQEFHIQINDGYQIFEIGYSPGMRLITPFAITPCAQFLKQINVQPIKNEECDLAYINIRNQVMRNTSLRMQSPVISIRNPSSNSAFKQCFQSFGQ